MKYAERLAELSAERAERTREAAQRHYEALTAEASRKFRESIREIKSILEKYGKEERKEFLRELGRHLGPAVYKALPDRIHLLVKAADPMRVVKHVSHELYDILAKAEEAYRIYRRLEKYLVKSTMAPPSPAPDYSVAAFIEGRAKYRRRVVEGAAAELSYHWLRARAGLLLKIDVTSIAYWHREGQIKLPPEAVKALKAMGAYRKAKLLAERGVEPTPLEIVKARLESDVLAIVAASKATPVAKELGEIATALAFHWMLGKLRLPALVVEWIREYRPEDWRRAKEAVEAFKRGDADAAKRLIALNAEEALARFKAAVSKFVEEAVSIARFSPGAYQRVKEIAEDLSRGGPLEKYLATKIAEALRRVEPLRAPDVEAFKSLPEAVKDGLNRLVRNLEERMLREGYFDAVVKPFSRLFGIGDPRELAGRAAAKLRELWRVDLRDGEAYVTGYRQRAEEAYAKALRELEELARAPLAEAAGRAERVFDALAEALSYLVEDRFIAWSEENKDYFNGDELAKTALEIVKEVLGVEARELAAEAIARALGRWAEIGAREYPAWLSQGRLPSTLHLAVVLKTEKYADLLSRRLQVITAAGGGEEGWKIHVFAFHPTLREVVERVRSMIADMLSKGKDVPGHIGIAPVEFVFTVANAWITDEGIATSRLGREFEDKLKEAFDYVITPPRPGEYKQPVDYGAIRRYDVYLAVRADPELKVFAEMYGDEWWKAVEAAAGYKLGEMLMRQLREEYGKRGGRRELLWEWESGASGYDVVGLLYYLTGSIEAEAARANRMLEELKAYLKWLASPAQLVPKADPHKWREDNPIFQAAVRIYAAVTGKKLEEVWQEAVERLRAIQPPGVKQELKEEQRGAQRPPAEAAEREKPAEKAEEKQAPSYKEAKAAEKPGEGMRGKAAERPGERAEERGRAAERAEEGAKRPLEKAVERPSERAEGAGQRPLKAEAAGLIPPSKADLSAVTWLVGVLGRREMGREEAEALRRAVRKAVERVKAKYGPRLYKTGGEALAELADRAAEEAFTLAATAAESPEAVRYMLLLLENAEGPAFGLAPKSPLEADAARVFAKVAEYVKRAEAEFGAGLLVWNYARAVAEAVLREAERVWEDAYKGIATVEQAVKTAVIAAAGVAGALAVHDGLYSTAVVSATTAAVILAREGAFERAVEYVRRAAEAAYEAAREVFEKAKIALERLYELFVEAVARALDYIRAHWFIIAATAAGLIAYAVAQQLDYTLWQNHIALNAGAIAGLAKATGVGGKWKEVRDAILTRTAAEKEVVERIAQLGLDNVVEKALNALSTLRHTMDEEQVKSAVLELKRLASYVQAMKAANYKRILEEATKAWYEQRDPAALWTLKVLGARETGTGVKVFEDEDDKVAYLIASFVLLSRLKEFVELKNKSYEAFKRLEKAVEKGGFALSDVWDDINALAEAKERAREVANELNTIASRLEGAGFSGIAERLKVTMENVMALAKAAADDLPAVNATRGERATAALLSLVTGGLFGVTVERALAERGEKIAGALSVVSAVRSTPKGFYEVFSSVSGGEEPSEAKKLAFRIVSLLTDPTMRAVLADRQGAEIRVQKTENGKRLIYATFVENGRELLKTAWEDGKWLIPLWAEGEVVRPIKGVASLVKALSSGSKPLEGLNEEAWKRVVETAERVKRAVKSIAKTITIGALPTDAVLLPGSEYAHGASSYLSQAFTYWALAEGKISLDKVYPSEEGLKPMWYVVDKYTKTVHKVLSRGRNALNKLLESGVDLKAALADVIMSNELKTALETAAGEFWGRVEELFSQWREAKEKSDKEAVDRLGKYVRVLLPLAYAVEAYKRGELPREEAALAVIFAVLYDGSVLRDEIRLAVGGPEHEEKPIMTHDNFTAFWLWALKELGFKPSAVYPGKGSHHIVFKGAELNELLKAVALALPSLHELRDTLAEFADAFKAVSGEVIKRKFGIEWAYDVRNEMFFKKLEEIITMTEDYAYRNIAVERGPLDTSGRMPKTAIRFKLGGEEVAYITVYWRGDELYAQYGGSRESAERLASVIRALGGDAEVKYVKGAGWGTWLTTDGIIAIRHDGWLKAVRSFVDELYNKGVMSKERYEKLIKNIEAGPNIVKFYGAKFSVYYETGAKRIDVKYQPSDENSKNAAVNALKDRGLREGVHFTVKEHSGSYEIYIAKEAYAKALEALTHSGLKEKKHYAVYDKRRLIRVKKDHKDAVVNALKAAGLVEGKDFTVKSNKQYEIRITYDGLREIQRMALNGDVEAEQFIRELEDVLRRRHGDNAVKKLMEVLTPAREESTLELPLAVRDERGNLIAHVVDLKYEFVKGGQSVDQCAGEDCHLRVVVEYELPSGERRQLKTEWYWARLQEKKGRDTVTYYYEMAIVTAKDDVEAAVLKALTGKAKRGRAHLYADQLDALRRFKALKDAIDKWRAGKPKARQ
ncbi:PaRep2b protein [Pyrobaculum aerophilum]|uniref:PaRep2b protein n=1 Tax=Pyrobaculum aerophilum TaxID=13773 RepID=UPI0023F45A21|nr:PaRep2b protein [Pyrobaculum aerophilum]MCX8137437.1 PaRep2b protein [Pyrobaculum aerophilum]